MLKLNLKKLLPWAVPALIQLFFLISGLTTEHTKTRDSQEYLNQAYNILHNQTFYCGEPGQPVTDVSLYSRRPPGYGVFILVTSLFLTTPVLTLIIQCILSIFNLSLAYRIARLLNPGLKSPVIIILLGCMLPSQFILAATYMTEIPFQSIVLLSGYYLLRYEQADGRFRHLYLHHFFIFCAYMTKPIAGLLWVISALYIIITQKESRSVIRLAVLSTLHMVVIALGLIRNYYYTGIAEGSSIPHKVVINYNLPLFLTEVYGASRSSFLVDSIQEEMNKRPYAYQSAIADQFIRQQISAHWPTYLVVHLRGMVKFFIDPGRWELLLWKEGWEEAENPASIVDTYRKSGIDGVLKISGYPLLILTLWAVIGSVLTAVLLLLWLLNRKVTRHSKFFIAGLLFYFSMMTGPSASARLRMPVFPLMIAASGLMASGIIHRKGALLHSDKL